MHVALLYAAPPKELFTKLDPKSLAGDYRHDPVENDWHTGTISVASDGKLVWTNAAGTTWRLKPDLARGLLRTESDCPYYGKPGGDAFRIVLARDANGRYQPKVAGYQFNGAFYAKLGK